MARWQPARTDVIAEYAAEVLRVHPRGRLVIGVDGIEHPGETGQRSSREAFAADLADAFRAQGVPSQAQRMVEYAVGLPDGRLDPGRPPEALYDVQRFREEELVPYRAGRRALVTRGAEPRDGVGWTIDPAQPLDRQVLVVSGPFLHFGDLAGIWHSSAWIALPRAVARRRDAERAGAPEDSPELRVWDSLVETAFRRLDARKLSNATFDLTDEQHPRRRFEDAC